jgi:hypothetical protein
MLTPANSNCFDLAVKLHLRQMITFPAQKLTPSPMKIIREIENAVHCDNI